MIGGRAVGWHHIVHTFSCDHRRCVLSLNAKFPLHRPGAAGRTQHQHSEDRRHTHTQTRWNRKSLKCLRVICNLKVSLIILLQYLSINFHTFFFFCRYDLYFFVAHSRTHTHSTAGRRCCFSRLVMDCITSHRIDENDMNDNQAMHSSLFKIEI